MIGRVEIKGALFQRALHLQLNMPAGPYLPPKWRKIVGIFLCFTCTKGIGMLVQGGHFYSHDLPPFFRQPSQKRPFIGGKN